MKKKIIIGLTCLCAGLGIAGCGANSTTTETTTTVATTTAETTTETTTTAETTTATTEATTTTEEQTTAANLDYKQYDVNAPIWEDDNIKLSMLGIRQSDDGVLLYGFEAEKKENDGKVYEVLMQDIWVNGKERIPPMYIYDTIEDGQKKNLNITYYNPDSPVTEDIKNISLVLVVHTTDGEEILKTEPFEFSF